MEIAAHEQSAHIALGEQACKISGLFAASVGVALLASSLLSNPESSTSLPAMLAAESHSPTLPSIVTSPQAQDELVVSADHYQLTYINIETGEHIGTVGERFARPALSLAKLYIADFVFKHGTSAEAKLAQEMIVASDDVIANQLYAKYPDSITETALNYNLQSTIDGGRWGYSYTSSFDVASFIAQLLIGDPNSPVLTAMQRPHDIAADGTEQDFGTATVQGVKGSKWGWSDDKTLHSSVSFGEDFVIAAAISGSADDLSAFVQAQLSKR